MKFKAVKEKNNFVFVNEKRNDSQKDKFKIPVRSFLKGKPNVKRKSK